MSNLALGKLVRILATNGAPLGSGIIVNDRGGIVTCRHVLATQIPDSRLLVQWEDAQGISHHFTASIRFAQSSHDLALLEITDTGAAVRGIEPAVFSSSIEESAAQSVMLWGYPLPSEDDGYDCSHGHSVPGKLVRKDTHLRIETSRPLSRGMSGGAVLSAENKVIGIIWKDPGGRTNQCEAIGCEAVASYMRSYPNGIHAPYGWFRDVGARGDKTSWTSRPLLRPNYLADRTIILGQLRASIDKRGVRRVVLYGKRGTGKSTVARLAEASGIFAAADYALYWDFDRRPSLELCLDWFLRDLGVSSLERRSLSGIDARVAMLEQRLRVRPCLVVLDSCEVLTSSHRSDLKALKSLLDADCFRNGASSFVVTTIRGTPNALAPPGETRELLCMDVPLLRRKPDDATDFGEYRAAVVDLQHANGLTHVEPAATMDAVAKRVFEELSPLERAVVSLVSIVGYIPKIDFARVLLQSLPLLHAPPVTASELTHCLNRLEDRRLLSRCGGHVGAFATHEGTRRGVTQAAELCYAAWGDIQRRVHTCAAKWYEKEALRIEEEPALSDMEDMLSCYRHYVMAAEWKTAVIYLYGVIMKMDRYYLVYSLDAHTTALAACLLLFQDHDPLGTCYLESEDGCADFHLRLLAGIAHIYIWLGAAKSAWAVMAHCDRIARRLPAAQRSWTARRVLVYHARNRFWMEVLRNRPGRIRQYVRQMQQPGITLEMKTTNALLRAVTGRNVANLRRLVREALLATDSTELRYAILGGAAAMSLKCRNASDLVEAAELISHRLSSQKWTGLEICAVVLVAQALDRKVECVAAQLWTRGKELWLSNGWSAALWVLLEPRLRHADAARAMQDY